MSETGKDLTARPPLLEDAPYAVQLVFKPIEPFLPMLRGTADKPLGELTVIEAAGWILVFGYVIAVGALGGRIATNVAVNVLRAPRR